MVAGERESALNLKTGAPVGAEPSDIATDYPVLVGANEFAPTHPPNEVFRLKRLVDIRRAFFWPLCGMVLMACGVQEVRAESATIVDAQIRLSRWLSMTLDPAQQPAERSSGKTLFTPYFPGVVWMVPEEAQEQGRLKSQLLEHIQAENSSPGVSRTDAIKLARFVESLPVTGRVMLEKADPRWLEVNPTHDPVLRKGQRVLIPSRPVSVTVVGGDGQLCQVTHSVHSFALDYVRKCDATRSPQIAWIVQPDGWVQRHGVSNWNQNEQDPPAPGAWIVTDDPATPWPVTLLEQLARLLATQGVANDPDISRILPQPDMPNEVISGHPDKPRDLQLSLSDWGSVGLLQTPTARMNMAGEASISVSHSSPYTWMNGDIQPLDSLEVSLRYTSLSNALYGPAIAGTQTYKDKSLDIKLKLADESNFMPQIALGFRDIGGTGLFSGEYVVGSKRTGNMDWSLGLGWGGMGARGNLGNPFSVLSTSFSARQAGNSAGTGGKINTSSMFTGPTALFGGVQYQTPWSPLLLKLEYDGNNYQHEPFGNNLKQSSPLNAGMVYRLNPALDLSMGWERGSTLNLGVNFHGDLSKLTTPKLSDPQPEKVSPVYPTGEPDWAKVSALLEEKTSWRVLQIKRAGSEVIVRFERADAKYWNSYIDRIASVLHRYVPGRNVMVFRIQAADYALGMHEYLIDRLAWVEAKTGFIPAHHKQSAVFEQPEYEGFIYPVTEALIDKQPKQFDGKMGITYKQSLGGPDGFILYQVGLGTTGNWTFQPNTWWTGSVEYGVIDNFNKFKYDAPSNLPRVRTYMREYLTTSNITMPTFQLTHVGKLNNENFYSVYGGMLENMYGGIGAEWLYRPWQSSVAFGVDINEVKQRGFSQNFSFLNPQYKIMTGHASLYWEGMNDINVTLRVGRYLAGDVGATLDMSRVFRNGVKIGAFASKTNVSAAVFGEGSFDKGIYVDIPFDAFLIRSSADYAHILYHPLTRDGGALLNRQFPLANLTSKQSGNLLKWHPFSTDRETQFGDVPDNFSGINSHDSLFTTVRNDLTELGHTATTPDFWRSMLLIGGVSLGSAVLDKRADKLAVKYGAGTAMKRVETVGNNLPVVALAYSGLMYLTSDKDSRLAKASYSSLAAGGVGFMGTLGLKYMVGRARPNLEQGSASFTPASKNNSNSSWPSGHTTMMWAAITPYAKAYDAPWLYGLAAVTNVARIGGRNHWLSDTVGGALLGYAIGDFMWESHKTTKRGAEWVVSPNGVTAYWKIE